MNDEKWCNPEPLTPTKINFDNDERSGNEFHVNEKYKNEEQLIKDIDPSSKADGDDGPKKYTFFKPKNRTKVKHWHFENPRRNHLQIEVLVKIFYVLNHGGPWLVSHKSQLAPGN